MDKEQLLAVGKQALVVLLVALLALILFSLGLMVGYAVVGDGDNAFSILSPDKWQELIAKFTGK